MSTVDALITHGINLLCVVHLAGENNNVGPFPL